MGVLGGLHISGRRELGRVVPDFGGVGTPFRNLGTGVHSLDFGHHGERWLFIELTPVMVVFCC